MSPKSPYKKFFLLKPNTEIGSLPSVSFSVISALAYLGFQGLLPPYSQYTVHLSVCSTFVLDTCRPPLDAKQGPARLQAWRPFGPPFLVGKTPTSLIFPEF